MNVSRRRVKISSLGARRFICVRRNPRIERRCARRCKLFSVPRYTARTCSSVAGFSDSEQSKCATY